MSFVCFLAALKQLFRYISRDSYIFYVILNVVEMGGHDRFSTVEFSGNWIVGCCFWSRDLFHWIRVAISCNLPVWMLKAIAYEPGNHIFHVCFSICLYMFVS